MAKNVMKYGWWVQGAGWPCEEAEQETVGKKPEETAMKTVLVYRQDKKTLGVEPLGIIVERRKMERGNNVLGMLHLARKVFSKTETDSARIIIGEY